MNINLPAWTETKKIRNALFVIVGLIVLLVTFQTGILVGEHKANFSHNLGENYFRAFDVDNHGEFGGFLGNFGDDNLPSAHGASGKIVRVSLPTFVVAGSDNVEKVITIAPDVSIRKFRDTATTTDLSVGDFVVVLGEPDARGIINAHLIRILPAPDSAQVMGSTSPNQ